MPSYNLVALIGLSFLVASSVAPPPPAYNGERGPYHGPYRGPPAYHIPSESQTLVNPVTISSTGGSSGGPIFPTGGPVLPTGGFPTSGFPTGIVPSGTAIPTGRRPDIPWPTIDTREANLHRKRFEGPRGRGPKKPWKPFRPTRPTPTPGAPSSPPVVSGGGVRPTGVEGPPGTGPTAPPGGIPAPTGVFPTAS